MADNSLYQPPHHHNPPGPQHRKRYSASLSLYSPPVASPKAPKENRPPALSLRSLDGLSPQPPSATFSRDSSTKLHSPATPGYPRTRRLSTSSTAKSPKPQSSSESNKYFSAQASTSGGESKSPSARRPPASHSSGIDTSYGPPITLITRGSNSVERTRRVQSQNSKDFAFAHHQLRQSGLVSPGTPGSRRSSVADQKLIATTEGSDLGQEEGNAQLIPSSLDGSSENDVRPRDRSMDRYANRNSRAGGDVDQTGQSEDLFLNLAEDSPQAQGIEDGTNGVFRQKSRIARPHHRQSLSETVQSTRARRDSAPGDTNAALRTPTASSTFNHSRRMSQLPSPSINTRVTPRDHTPASAGSADRYRYSGISPPSSASTSRNREQDPSIYSPVYARRGQTLQDALQASSNRTHKPSNLQYSSSRDDGSVHIDTPERVASQANFSGAEGTESVDSGPAPSTVWDELDDLKSRIRRIELAGKMPSTSAAAVSAETGDRPRTATTTVTTVSSSPKQKRKASVSAADGRNSSTGNLHPLLHQALAKTKDSVPTSVYRSLEATISEALELVAMAGSSGPQGTAFSVASIINGSHVPDRLVRRKADNLCRNLTELCIALCEVTSPKSPAFQRLAEARRGSIQTNGEQQSPAAHNSQIRASIEPESGESPHRSPSRALSRIEARRSSLLGLNGRHGTSRESSIEPEQPGTPLPRTTRVPRTNTSLRTRRAYLQDESEAHEDEEETTLRVPSRAMTDFTAHRRPVQSTAPRSNRLSRDYTQPPVPDMQSHLYSSSSAAQANGLRRSSVVDQNLTTSSGTSSLLRDGSRRYLERGTPPSASFDKESIVRRSEERRVAQPSNQYSPSTRSPAGVSGLSRSGSLARRLG